MPSSPSSPSPSEASDISSSDQSLSPSSSPVSCRSPLISASPRPPLSSSSLLSSSPPSASSSPSPSSPSSGSGLPSSSPSTSSRSRSSLVARAAKAAWSSSARPSASRSAPAFSSIQSATKPSPARAACGRRLAGQPLADQEPDRRGQRHLLAASRAHQGIGLQPHLGQPREIGADPGHAARAQRLDPRLLGGVEHGAGDVVGGRAAPVQRRIVVPKPKRRRIGEAARLRRLVRADRPPRHRRLDRLARHRRRVAGEAQLDLRVPARSPASPRPARGGRLRGDWLRPSTRASSQPNAANAGSRVIDGQPVDQRLRGQHSIERIAMPAGQEREPERMTSVVTGCRNCCRSSTADRLR